MNAWSADRILGAIPWERIAESAWHILLALALMFVALRATRFFLRRLEGVLVARGERTELVPGETRKRVATLVNLLRYSAGVAILVIGALVILQEVGIQVGPLLAGAGIVGVAIGFGAQNLVRDVISGFLMILENQVRVGDVAVINNVGGLVESIGLRTVVLRDVEGAVHIFPHGLITSLSNKTKDWSAYVLDIGVAAKEDTDRAVAVMRAVDDELRADPLFGSSMLEPIEVMGVDKFGEFDVIVKARLKTLPGKQWEVGREYRRRLKKAFEAAGVAGGTPQRIVYLEGADKLAGTPGLAHRHGDDGRTLSESRDSAL